MGNNQSTRAQDSWKKCLLWIGLSLVFFLGIEVVGGHLNPSRGLVPGGRGWIGWMERHSSLSRPQSRLVVASRCNGGTRYTPLSNSDFTVHLFAHHLTCAQLHNMLSQVPEHYSLAGRRPMHGPTIIFRYILRYKTISFLHRCITSLATIPSQEKCVLLT